MAKELVLLIYWELTSWVSEFAYLLEFPCILEWCVQCFCVPV